MSTANQHPFDDILMGIPCRILPVETPDRFEVKYKNQIKILSALRYGTRRIAAELVVGSVLLMGTDDNGQLNELELMLPMSKWLKKNYPAPPEKKRMGRLLFPDFQDKEKDHFIDMIPTVYYSEPKKEVTILFHQNLIGKEAVSVANSVTALLLQNVLTGFILKI